MRIVRLPFALVVFITLWFAEVGAFPINPQTLRVLTAGSELIVSAKVEKIILIKGEDGYNTGIARLNILSVAKGAEGIQSVEVYYLPGPAELRRRRHSARLFEAKREYAGLRHGWAFLWREEVERS
jgi:hypothetical protein